MTRSRQLLVEQLEDRRVMSVFGVPWPDAANLTLSFAPDGTRVDGCGSVLFQSFDGAFATEQWQLEILRAFQTWAVNADINIGLVADAGEAIGSPGAVQGDARYGDIRIAGHSLTTHLAINSPFSTLTGTRSGDMILNTDYPFGIGNPFAYDLFSVTLSEAGNIFGLADSEDINSPMYGYYTGIRTELTADDVAQLQDLYGTRDPDAHERLSGNDSFATAKALSFENRTSRLSADITTLEDVDVYRFRTSSDEFSVRLETAGRSLLVGRLSVYDADGNLVATVSSSSPLEGNLLLTVQNPLEDATYYVTVESATQDVFGIGGYQLVTKKGPGDPAPEDDSTKILNDNYTNDTLTEATNLDRRRFQTDRRFDYAVQAKIRDGSDIDSYKITSPVDAGNGDYAMTVMAWGLDQSLWAKLEIYDKDFNLLSNESEVLVNDDGTYVLQLRGPAPDQEYYIRVAAADPLSHNTGKYFLGVDFGMEAIRMDSAGQGTFHGQTQPQDWRTLENRKDQVFHFVLAASRDPAIDTAIRMTIYDIFGNVVFTMVSKNGEARSANVYLVRGWYTVRLEAGARGGVTMPDLEYELFATVVTDPIDPMPLDISLDPTGHSPKFAWHVFPDSYSDLELRDPYSDPWTGL